MKSLPKTYGQVRLPSPWRSMEWSNFSARKLVTTHWYSWRIAAMSPSWLDPLTSSKFRRSHQPPSRGKTSVWTRSARSLWFGTVTWCANSCFSTARARKSLGSFCQRTTNTCKRKTLDSRVLITSAALDWSAVNLNWSISCLSYSDEDLVLLLMQVKLI